MPRLFLAPDAAPVPGARLALPEAAARHAQVLRLQPGDTLTVFDGRGGEYAATVTQMGKRSVEVQIGTFDPAERESPLQLTLIQAVAAAERMDYAIQKATELGVAAIVPVNSAYSQGRLGGERAQKRHAHWQGVAVAACEQSGRTRVPQIAPVADLAKVLAAPPQAGLRLLLSPRGAVSLDALPHEAGAATVLIGPEGGLSREEEDAARAAGFMPLCLGPRVLRTETAAAVTLALLQARWGDLG
ncbi:16S rRNA (uracil(1498)-N(3))-methyltransferase [Chitiniphilus purpureus]|uniref:Ribosomal RNA small subunit methyltransferase E n=1 Tax=Chitiniphilus purpureus TaxID=2981137 RepID=A0ABY6DMI5_9NEIS|nr:16S rRNA (uracil(1498)-N(3))-methyltransferase [Chitiniphilus sp. CD1]UXY15577.1 16S rRNA (uracil(1498)-N(3))-methyltransferase [Chitiniphilus sp. CD1]